MVKYRFVCSCGEFEATDEDRKKVIEAAKKHAETCAHLKGADEIALEAMTEIIE